MAIRQHERVIPVQLADHVIRRAVNTAASDYDLSTIELLQILTGLQQTWLKFALRLERHPEDPDKGGDEE